MVKQFLTLDFSAGLTQVLLRRMQGVAKHFELSNHFGFLIIQFAQSLMYF